MEFVCFLSQANAERTTRDTTETSQNLPLSTPSEASEASQLREGDDIGVGKGSGDAEESRRNATEVGGEKQADTRPEVAKYGGVCSAIIEHFTERFLCRLSCTTVSLWCTSLFLLDVPS